MELGQEIKQVVFVTNAFEGLVKNFHDHLINKDLITIVDTWLKFKLSESKNYSENLKDMLKIILFKPIELSFQGQYIFLFDGHPKLKISIKTLTIGIIDFINTFINYDQLFFRKMIPGGLDDPKYLNFAFNYILNSLLIRERIVFLFVHRFISTSHPEYRVGAKGIGDILKLVCAECIKEHNLSLQDNTNSSPLVERKRNDQDKAMWNQYYLHDDNATSNDNYRFREEEEEEEDMDTDDTNEEEEKRLKTIKILRESNRLKEESKGYQKKKEEIQAKEEKKFQYDPMIFFRKIIKLVTTIEFPNDINPSRIDTILNLFLQDSGSMDQLTYI
jgi:hypothetical protein